MLHGGLLACGECHKPHLLATLAGKPASDSNLRFAEECCAPRAGTTASFNGEPVCTSSLPEDVRHQRRFVVRRLAVRQRICALENPSRRSPRIRLGRRSIRGSGRIAHTLRTCQGLGLDRAGQRIHAAACNVCGNGSRYAPSGAKPTPRASALGFLTRWGQLEDENEIRKTN